MTPAARLAAVAELIQAIEETPRRPADATANDFFRARRFIGGGDRRVVADTLWAIVRQRLRLDWHLQRAGAAPSARLLLAAHLALAEGRALAAIEEVFAGGRFALEPFDAKERRAVAAMIGKPLRDAAMPDSAALNIPAWALPLFQERFGAALPEEAAAMERAAPLDLRANLLRTTREAATIALAGEGVATQPTLYSPWGLRAEGRKPVTGTEAFKAGLIEVQDEGSQLIALLTDARPGMRVADYCAGAAGKTLAIAATMQNKGRITACDTSATRLEGAVKRLRRAGVDNAERHLLTAGDKWTKRRAGSFDRVLVDAPCTGSGTWRRNPDARLRTEPADLNELVNLQSEILNRAAELVRPGGRLVYATCSLFSAENEGQMDRFLERHPDFAPVPLLELWSELRPGVDAPGAGPWLATSPARHGTDGFFAAVLARRPS
ncbi:MAG TPA: RsmB/NOP family class I SAM-dependent RNA methyltransferase [Roseomonas sp.]|jgi:16S rRNA (cytosine967-C5)-methyltransferase